MGVVVYPPPPFVRVYKRPIGYTSQRVRKVRKIRFVKPAGLSLSPHFYYREPQPAKETVSRGKIRVCPRPSLKHSFRSSQYTRWTGGWAAGIPHPRTSPDTSPSGQQQTVLASWFRKIWDTGSNEYSSYRRKLMCHTFSQVLSLVTPSRSRTSTCQPILTPRTHF